MAKSIRILVGTVTGTAELVAEEVQPVLEEAGYRVEVMDLDGQEPAVLSGPDFILVCTSTYGQGDVPDNAIDFFDALEAGRPDLSSLRYGLIGLGDSTYADTYNQGCQRFDALFTELGGRRIGETMTHNASSDELPEEAGVEWARQWLGELNA